MTIEFSVFSKYGSNPLTSIPNYQGSWGVLHPIVRYFPGGIDGYKYWMCYTPDPPVNAENPCIVRSNDKYFWTGTGISNPVVTIPYVDQYTCAGDPDFMYIPQYGKWLLLHANNPDNYNMWIDYVYSTDGKTYLNRRTLVDGLQSYEQGTGIRAGHPWVSEPTTIFEDGLFTMWYMVPNGITIVNNGHWVAKATFTWNDATNTIENLTRYGPVFYPAQDATYKAGIGHVSVSMYNGEYIMVGVREPLSPNDLKFRVVMYKSTDKVNWNFYGTLLTPGTSGAWDDAMLYKSFLATDGVGNLVVFPGNEVLLYYSAWADQYDNPKIGLAMATVSIVGDGNASASGTAATSSTGNATVVVDASPVADGVGATSATGDAAATVDADAAISGTESAGATGPSLATSDVNEDEALGLPIRDADGYILKLYDDAGHRLGIWEASVNSDAMATGSESHSETGSIEEPQQHVAGGGLGWTWEYQRRVHEAEQYWEQQKRLKEAAELEAEQREESLSQAIENHRQVAVLRHEFEAARAETVIAEQELARAHEEYLSALSALQEAEKRHIREEAEKIQAAALEAERLQQEQEVVEVMMLLMMEV